MLTVMLVIGISLRFSFQGLIQLLDMAKFYFLSRLLVTHCQVFTSPSPLSEEYALFYFSVVEEEHA